MKVAALFSGGKDSTYAVYWAVQQGFEVECLLTMISMNKDSFMFHTPNINLSETQAECLSMPIVFGETKGEKEEELKDLKSLIMRTKQEFGVKAIVTGAVASEYQKKRIENICSELGLKMFSPLWGKDQEQVLIDMIEAGFEIIIIQVAALGLDKSFLGCKIDKEMLLRLKEVHATYKIHIAGEGGEFETFVIDGPIFKERIYIEEAEIEMEDENRGVYFIKTISKKDKTVT